MTRTASLIYEKDQKRAGPECLQDRDDCFLGEFFTLDGETRLN